MQPNIIWCVGVLPKKVLVLEKKMKKSIVDFKLGCKFALENDYYSKIIIIKSKTSKLEKYKAVSKRL